MKFLMGVVCASSAVALTLAGAAAAQDEPEGAPAPRSPFQSEPLGAGPWDIATEDAQLQVEVLTRDLERPWGMAFLPDSRMLVTERPGRLRIVDGQGNLDPEPIAGLPRVFALGIAGLTDVVLHPDFTNNRLIYLSYSKPAADAPEQLTPTVDTTLAVMRAKWDGGHQLTDVEDIWIADAWYGKPPLAEKCCGQGPAFGSYGARMAFGGDGKLYITSGDRNFGERVQDPTNHFGKIVRLNDDGSVPEDNPHAGEEGWLADIWTTGHRNPTGLTYDAETGRIWSTEFGPRGGDELNLIEKSNNYGWMSVTQGQHYDGTPAEGVKEVPGMTDPVVAWGPPSHNPGNLAVYRGNAFPAWQGDILVAAMDRSLKRIEIDGEGRATEEEAMLSELGQRLRDVRVGPDGAVYILTDETEGALLKVTPLE